MRDDEKMFNIGWVLAGFVICLTVFLQVCYRVQNNNLKSIRSAMQNNRQKIALEETKFSALSAGGSLRSSFKETYPKAETVSFSKIVNIDDRPMATE